jgi:hypothetical protein
VTTGVVTTDGVEPLVVADAVLVVVEVFVGVAGGELFEDELLELPHEASASEAASARQQGAIRILILWRSGAQILLRRPSAWQYPNPWRLTTQAIASNRPAPPCSDRTRSGARSSSSRPRCCSI